MDELTANREVWTDMVKSGDMTPGEFSVQVRRTLLYCSPSLSLSYQILRSKMTFAGNRNTS